jgi:hypothetical protein
MHDVVHNEDQSPACVGALGSLEKAGCIDETVNRVGVQRDALHPVPCPMMRRMNRSASWKR